MRMRMEKCRLLLGQITLLALLSACKQHTNISESPHMIQLSPRVAAAFEKVKTVCFGRFEVEVPENTQVTWGRALVPLAVDIYVDGVNEVKEMEKNFIDELKSEKAIYLNHVPLLISVTDVRDPDGRLVVGHDGFEAINGLRINRYFTLNNDGVVIETRPLRAHKDETIALINSTASRLRPRHENEIPDEPGNCIEHGFLPDLANPTKEDLMEHIRIGFRLKEFPDAHFSIYVAPSNPHDPESDSLETQFKRIKGDPATPEEMKVLSHIKYFRESPRKIHDWDTGYEVLMRTPDEDGSLSHHDFLMKFTGVPHNPYKPYADIQFQTGVVDDAAGAGKASLTDDEAVAVWDKITSTIRVRPTGASAKRASADLPRLPLGELAATGRVCPQTGWWQPSEANTVDGGSRQHFNAGERMPHVTLASKSSLWQKLTGQHAMYRAATLWKLVAYGDAPALVHSTPNTEERSSAHGKPARAGGDSDETIPPSHRG